jgi:hypothetical protein
MGQLAVVVPTRLTADEQAGLMNEFVELAAQSASRQLTERRGLRGRQDDGQRGPSGRQLE